MSQIDWRCFILKGSDCPKIASRHWKELIMLAIGLLLMLQVMLPSPEPIHQKQFVLCKILITPLGYMTLCEEGTLRKGDGRDHLRDGHYQWYGPLYVKMKVHEGIIHEGFQLIALPFVLQLRRCRTRWFGSSWIVSNRLWKRCDIALAVRLPCFHTGSGAI